MMKKTVLDEGVWFSPEGGSLCSGPEFLGGLGFRLRTAPGSASHASLVLRRGFSLNIFFLIANTKY